MRGERLVQQGLKGILPSQGLDAMSLVMAQGNPQLGVMSLNAEKWCAAQPATVRSSIFKNLLNQNGTETNKRKTPSKNIRDELLEAEPGRQRRLLFDSHVREYVAQVLHLPASRIPLDKPLKTLGLDSLMSIELRNRLEDALGLALSATLIWNYPTIHALTPFLAEKMGLPLEEDKSQVSAGKEAEPAFQELDHLDKGEIEALLAEELSAIDDSLKGSGFDTKI
jgi:acyl carrier protein